MTFFAVVVCAIITIIILGVGIYLAYVFFADESFYVGALTIVGIIVILALTWGLPVWYFQNTASGKRALKSQNSNFNNGIQREIIVYDIEGDVIERYSGKFDIDYSSERILFDDEEGNRHIVYFKTGTIVVNEISDE